MSALAFGLACKVQCPTPPSKLLLLLLANRAGLDGLIFPSQTTLAEESGLSERAVREHLARLEDAQLIKRTRRTRGDGSRTSDSFELLYLPADFVWPEAVQPAKSSKANRQDKAFQPARSAGLNYEDNLQEESSSLRSDILEAEFEDVPLTDEERAAKEEADRLAAEAAKEAARLEAIAMSSAFDKFWHFYHRKVAKPKAIAAYKKAVERIRKERPDADPHEVILEGLRAHWKGFELLHKTKQDFAIPHPTTWLNQDRYNDRPENGGANVQIPRDHQRQQRIDNALDGARQFLEEE
ncbi:DNA-binding protein [Caulobacter phage Sansa]|uniref:DNA-binding protein n=1 Tax=Caulobacter phage Sansa TaxID=1675600 RepID=A0A0K1LMQ7_9CAUD|nr:replication initiation protein [Caulobacter phage Sansa]AKU43488.1 DNA-binding protein [Caulobacter phage Sansa]